jgi:hypothetical protein
MVAGPLIPSHNCHPIVHRSPYRPTTVDTGRRSGVSLASWIGIAWMAVHVQSGRHSERADKIAD